MLVIIYFIKSIINSLRADLVFRASVLVDRHPNREMSLTTNLSVNSSLDICSLYQRF